MTDCLSESDLHYLHAKELNEREEVRIRQHLATRDQCARMDADLQADYDEIFSKLGGLDLANDGNLRATEDVTIRPGPLKPSVQIDGDDIVRELFHQMQPAPVAAWQCSNECSIAIPKPGAGRS